MNLLKTFWFFMAFQMPLIICYICKADTLIIANLGSVGSGSSYTLTQYTNGVYYGARPGGGEFANGTIYKITTNGTFSPLFYFSGTNGSIPYGGLVNVGGTFYGVTADGGTPNLAQDTCGTIYKISSMGDFISLMTFNGQNGYKPTGHLVQGSDGYLYGTTQFGGPQYDQINYPYSLGSGTIFKISTNGLFTLLAVFNGSNGSRPAGALLEVTNGIFYGTTLSGGSNNMGTVFQITADGTLTSLISFDGTNGANPQAGLIELSDGCFYGTAMSGGAITNQNGERPFGTIFKIDKFNRLTTLHSFSETSNDGSNPYAELVQGFDSNLYGTTSAGGSYDLGSLFQISPSGLFTTLYSFHDHFQLPFDGGEPLAGLVQSDDGYFYGTTYSGLFFRFPIPPSFASTIQKDEGVRFAWWSVLGGLYQVQYSTNLSLANWNNLGGYIVATNCLQTVFDSAPPDPQRFYRVFLSQ